MELDKFINLLATIFGALGAIYVLLGVINMTPELMEKLSQPQDWAFNEPQIESLAKQKADSISGFIFILIAFLLTLVNIVFVPNNIEAFRSNAVALALAAVLSGSLYLTLHFLSSGIYKHQRTAICKIVTSRFIDKIIKKGSFNINDANAIKGYAEKLHGLKFDANQHPRDIFYQVGKLINKEVPTTIDFSELSNKSKERRTQ